MKRPVLLGAIVLGCATALEVMFSGVAVSGPSGAAALRLIALGVILCGCLRNEFETAAFALVSAVVYSCAEAGGRLGCALVSFAAVGWLAGPAARVFFMDLLAVRVLVIAFLVLLESIVWSRLWTMFDPRYSAPVPWLAHGVAVLLGALIYPLLSRGMRYRSAPPVPMGRREYREEPSPRTPPQRPEGS